MSAYSSIRLTRSTAKDILWHEMQKAMSNDRRLLAVVDEILRRDSLYSVREIVENSEANDDDSVVHLYSP